ncbi:hypothetical protein PRK78_003668 [Emydomyces testavorans]|uniref:Yeast cell wall synthesis Kre9/Knh1-like N-terminal domain-containing protein n=1 Tax=Emydomyces testavorans TaxID=2070801 RepID=A0AAF0DGM8_9EURO|nr:hypothetical protein PRK78_003668 [Emydomyces testavorans]
MYFKLIAPVLAYIASVADPGNGVVWDVTKSQTVTWTSVETDPLTFAIELVNLSAYPPFTVRVARGIKTSAGSYSTKPLHNIPPGKGYQVNFMSEDPQVNGILAQSQQFVVANPGSHINSVSNKYATSTRKLVHSGNSMSHHPLSTGKTREPALTISATAMVATSSSSRSARTSATTTSTRRSSTTSATSTSAKSAQETSNAAPALQVYSGAGSLVFAALALIA